METDRHNISAGDKYEKALTSPRFNEETRAAARPVVPLGLTRNALGTTHRVRNNWSRGLALILAVFIVAGVAATLIYRNNGTSAPSTTSPTVSETIIEAVPEPESLEPSKPTARATTQKRMGERQSVLMMRDEPAERDWKALERRDDDEEKISERARKEEKKRLKRLRKEAEKLAEYERDSDDSERPKPRLVGIYTVRRRH